MQVSSWVKEAIDEAALYAALDHQPDVAASFLAPASPPLRAFAAALDVCFFNVINQSCGESRLSSRSARARARASERRACTFLAHARWLLCGCATRPCDDRC